MRQAQELVAGEARGSGYYRANGIMSSHLAYSDCQSYPAILAAIPPTLTHMPPSALLPKPLQPCPRNSCVAAQAIATVPVSQGCHVSRTKFHLQHTDTYIYNHQAPVPLVAAAPDTLDCDHGSPIKHFLLIPGSRPYSRRRPRQRPCSGSVAAFEESYWWKQKPISS